MNANPYRKATHLVTTGAIRAAVTLHTENPGLLVTAVRYCQNNQHANADEVESLAATIVAAFIPERFRLGYGLGYTNHPTSADNADRIARAAANQAKRRAAHAIHQEQQRTRSLDALTGGDPDALTALTDRQASNALRLPTPYGSNPTACTRLTTDDYLDAAVAVIPNQDHADTLTAGIEAWRTLGRQHQEPRSLLAALVTVSGWTNGSKERKRAERHLRAALDAIGPHAARVLTNPDGLTPPRQHAHWTETAKTEAGRQAHRYDADPERPFGAVHYQRGAQPVTTPGTAHTAPYTGPGGRLQAIPGDRQDAARTRHAAQVAEIQAAQARPAHLTVKATEADARGLHRAARRLRHRAAVAALITAPHGENGYRPAAEPTAETGHYATDHPATVVPVKTVTGWTAPSSTPSNIDAQPDPRTDGKPLPNVEGTCSAVIVRTRHGQGPIWEWTVTLQDPKTGATLYGPKPAQDWTPEHERIARQDLRTITPDVDTRPEYADTDPHKVGKYASHGSIEASNKTAEKQAAAPRLGKPKTPSRRAKNRTGSTGPTVPLWGVTRK